MNKKYKMPRDLNLTGFGTRLTVKADKRMSNMWIENVPLSLGKAKQLRTWLDKYIQHAENKVELFK